MNNRNSTSQELWCAQRFAMDNHPPNPRLHVRGKWFFLAAFIFSCFLFWWIPSVLFRLVVHQADAVDNESIVVSIVGLALFIAGYLFPAFAWPARPPSPQMLDACGGFAYKVTLLLASPALVLSILFWHSHTGHDYIGADPIPFGYQVVLYTHLFFGFMFFGSADPRKEGWRRILISIALVTLPRLIISLHWGRFFLAQAVVPALLMAIARGWISFSPRRIFQVVVVALVILFVPAMTREDFSLGQGDMVQWFAQGSTLKLYQDNTDLNLNGYCPPLLVSITAKSVPYVLLNVCIMDYNAQSMPATSGRIVTVNDPKTFQGTLGGAGSNYLLDLYLSGGILAVFAGSAAFGFSCRRFIGWIGQPSLFAGMWAECLTRALLAPRGELGYVYERIPSLVLTTWLVVLIVWAGRLLVIDRSKGNEAAGLAEVRHKPAQFPESLTGTPFSC